jgi:hypothetical protein
MVPANARLTRSSCASLYQFVVSYGKAENSRRVGDSTKGHGKLTEALGMRFGSAAKTAVTSPDELMAVLKRYLKTSNESEIVVASVLV